MAKCDICGTTIPYGTNQCPQCGYRYRPEKRMTTAKEKYREKKMDDYMSQFQPHPSPLDEVKKETTNIDLLDIFKSKPKPKSKKFKSNAGAKIVKWIIVWFILSSIVTVAIPIAINYFVGMDEWGEVTTYNYYYSYDDLEFEYPEVAKQVDPYLSYLANNSIDDRDSLWQSYTTYGDVLDYCMMSGTVESDSVYLTLQLTYYQANDWWEEAYICYDVFDQTLSINENLLLALSQKTGVEYKELYDAVEVHLNQVNMDDTFLAIYELGNGYTLQLDYFDYNLEFMLYREFLVLE